MLKVVYETYGDKNFLVCLLADETGCVEARFDAKEETVKEGAILEFINVKAKVDRGHINIRICRPNSVHYSKVKLGKPSTSLNISDKAWVKKVRSSWCSKRLYDCRVFLEIKLFSAIDTPPYVPSHSFDNLFNRLRILNLSIIIVRCSQLSSWSSYCPANRLKICSTVACLIEYCWMARLSLLSWNSLNILPIGVFDFNLNLKKAWKCSMTSVAPSLSLMKFSTFRPFS